MSRGGSTDHAYRHRELIVNNNAARPAAPLVQSGQISTMILSYVGTNKNLQDAYLAGKIALELGPQGTIAERLRAGGAGVPAVYTPTGAGTFVETGGIPRRLSAKVQGKKQTVVLEGKPKEVREFDGKRYLLEPAIKGDVAIIKAWKVDKAGNCVFRLVPVPSSRFAPCVLGPCTNTCLGQIHDKGFRRSHGSCSAPVNRRGELSEWFCPQAQTEQRTHGRPSTS